MNVEVVCTCNKERRIYSYVGKTMKTSTDEDQRDLGRRMWRTGWGQVLGAELAWRMGRTAEDRLMYRRSIKAATSGNGFYKWKRRQLLCAWQYMQCP